MSSASPEPGGGTPARPEGPWARGTLALRLTLGYAALFALSALALFGLTYLLLLGYMREQDRSFSRTQLRLYSEVYVTDGVAGVERAALAIRGDDRGEEMLLRLTDRANRTRLLLPPEDWTPADVEVLAARNPLAPTTVHNAREGQDAEVIVQRLPDGGVLQVGVSSDERDDVMESFPDVFLTISLPLLLLAVLGGALMARSALRPLRRLVTTLHSLIATGDVRERAPAPSGRGEVADLFRLFNQMLERIEALVTRLRGTMDDVAHDIRTPMTRLRGTAELALAGDHPPEVYRDALADTLEAAETVLTTLDTLLDVAEAESGALRLDRAPVDLADLVADVADLYELVADEKGVALAVLPGDPAPALADRKALRRAVANLVDNAVKYTPPGGRVTLRAVGGDAGPSIEVTDTGTGIAEGEIPRIWDRHFRGDRSRSERGLGLGLSLVRGIVEAHGGTVEVVSEPGKGSTFTLRLSPLQVGLPGAPAP